MSFFAVLFALLIEQLKPLPRRNPVHDADEFAGATAKADGKKGILIFVKRNGASIFVVLKDNK